MNRKQQPTRRQGDARRARAAHGEQVRGWLLRQAGRLEKARAKAAELREKQRAKNDKAEGDGVTRVPPTRTFEWVHRHTRPSRSQWRVGGRNRYTGKKNTPYVNPARDAKSAKSGRLRRELRP